MSNKRRGARRLPQLSLPPTPVIASFGTLESPGTAPVGIAQANAQQPQIQRQSYFFELKELFRRLFSLESIPPSGSGITEVDGSTHITSSVPTGPTTAISLDNFTQWEVAFGQSGGGDLDQSANFTYNKGTAVGRVANELIVDNFFYIPDDSNPGLVATSEFLKVTETTSGDGSELLTQGDIAGDKFDGVVIKTTGNTTSPESHVHIYATDDVAVAAKQGIELRAGKNLVTPPSGTNTSACEANFIVNTNDAILFRYYGYDSTLRIAQSGSGATNASLSFDLNPRWNSLVQSPSAGFTIDLSSTPNTRYLILVPAGTLATGTVKFPSAPFDGQVITISSTQVITLFTLSGNGNTVSNGVTTLGIGTLQAISYLFDSTATTWYPV